MPPGQTCFELSLKYLFFSRKDLYENLTSYFLGKWSGGVKKSYTDRKGNSGEADRFVAKQPFAFVKDSSDER